VHPLGRTSKFVYGTAILSNEACEGKARGSLVPHTCVSIRKRFEAKPADAKQSPPRVQH